ncbi:HGGxSTG domain-containing protein [Sneathiella chungangensis]|uniref:HGGxSTG domain-containing protein n=2 Tax=Sneathiella chungangensis TaxID=1418234 RepID=UPI003BB1EF13
MVLRARSSWGTVMREKIICGAKTRQGTPCRAKALKNGRCRNHGGLSTGPKTLEGKERSLAALKYGKYL